MHTFESLHRLERPYRTWEWFTTDLQIERSGERSDLELGTILAWPRFWRVSLGRTRYFDSVLEMSGNHARTLAHREDAARLESTSIVPPILS